MLGVKAVAERMADHLVDHDPTMPGVSKTAQAVHSTRRLEDSLHALIMTIVSYLCKKMAQAASSAENTQCVFGRWRAHRKSTVEASR
jgi:hypothetical protein